MRRRRRYRLSQASRSWGSQRFADMSKPNVKVILVNNAVTIAVRPRITNDNVTECFTPDDEVALVHRAVAVKIAGQCWQGDVSQVDVRHILSGTDFNPRRTSDIRRCDV